MPSAGDHRAGEGLGLTAGRNVRGYRGRAASAEAGVSARFRVIYSFCPSPQAGPALQVGPGVSLVSGYILFLSGSAGRARRRMPDRLLTPDRLYRSGPASAWFALVF